MILKVTVQAAPPRGKTVRHSKDVYRLMQFLKKADREQFYVLHLNSKHRLIAMEMISMGSLTSAVIHPREVFKGAILNNSHAIICVHNHPSGDSTPSKADKIITRRLRSAGVLLGIHMLEHLVIGDHGYSSILGVQHDQ